MKDLYECLGKGGDIPLEGKAKEYMGKYKDSSLRDMAGYVINDPNEALLDGLLANLKSKKR